MTIHFNINARDNLKQQIEHIANQPYDLFDDATSKIFNVLEEKVVQIKREITLLESQYNNYKEEEISTDNDIELDYKIENLNYEADWLIDQLNAMTEMKIVYLFKTIEINLKSIIVEAYPKIKTRSFYKWDNMISYFNNLNIRISKLEGYDEADELRNVNNSIKHSSTIDGNINKIREFAGKSQFTYADMNNFHTRIKPIIQNFVWLVGKEIITAISKKN